MCVRLSLCYWHHQRKDSRKRWISVLCYALAEDLERMSVVIDSLGEHRRGFPVTEKSRHRRLPIEQLLRFWSELAIGARHRQYVFQSQVPAPQIIELKLGPISCRQAISVNARHGSH